MRTGLRQALDGAPPAAGSLVAGLSVGDDSLAAARPGRGDEGQRPVPPDRGERRATWRSSSDWCFALVTVLRLPLPLRMVAALASLGYFVILVGPQPSVLRAAAMGVIAVVGVLAGGRRAGPSILGAGVLVLVVVAPWLAVSWAFALSAFATAGLILLAPGLEARLESGRADQAMAAGGPAGARAHRGRAAGHAADPGGHGRRGRLGGAAGQPAGHARGGTGHGARPAGRRGVAGGCRVSRTSWPRSAAWPAGWIATVAQTCADLPLAQPAVALGLDRPGPAGGRWRRPSCSCAEGSGAGHRRG